MTPGKRIADLRRSKNYSQEYLAEQLGISRQAVSKWEQDLTAPDTGNLIALAKLLDTSVEYLATGREPQTFAAQSGSNAASPPALTAGKILGIVFIAMGALSLILGVLFTWLLLAMSLIFFAVGILLLTVKKHATRLIVAILVLIMAGVAAAVPTGLNVSIVMALVLGSILLPILVFLTVMAVKKYMRKKSRVESDDTLS